VRQWCGGAVGIAIALLSTLSCPLVLGHHQAAFFLLPQHATVMQVVPQHSAVSLVSLVVLQRFPLSCGVRQHFSLVPQRSAAFFLRANAFCYGFPSCRGISLWFSRCHGIWQGACCGIRLSCRLAAFSFELRSSATFFFGAAAFGSVFPSCRCILLRFSFVPRHFATVFRMPWHSARGVCAAAFGCLARRLGAFSFELRSSATFFFGAAAFGSVFPSCRCILLRFSFVPRHFATVFRMPRHSARGVPRHSAVSSSCSVFFQAAEFGNIFLRSRRVRQRFSFVPRHIAMVFQMPPHLATFFFMPQCLEGVAHCAAALGGLARRAEAIEQPTDFNHYGQRWRLFPEKV